PRTRAAQPAAGQGHAQEASASVVIGNAGTSGSTALFAHQDDAGEDQDDHHRTDDAAYPPSGRTRICCVTGMDRHALIVSGDHYRYICTRQLYNTGVSARLEV